MIRSPFTQLRVKALLAAGLVLGPVVVCLYLLAAGLLQRGFGAAEDRLVEADLARVAAALREEVDQLNIRCADWARWNDACTFIEDANASFAAANLVPASLANLKLDLIIFVHRDGRVVAARELDAAAAEPRFIPCRRLDLVARERSLTGHRAPEDLVSGVLWTPDGPLAVSSRPIVTSDNQGPVRGTLLFGKYLGPAVLRAVGQRLGLSFELAAVDQPGAPAWAAAVAATPNTTPLRPEPLDQGTMAGLAAFPDLHGQPRFALRVLSPRVVHAQRQTSLGLILVSTVAIGAAGVALAFLAVEVLVTRRLLRLATEVEHVGRSGDLAQRINVGGRDELAQVAGRINELLNGLEDKDRQRTAAEQALGESEHKYRALFEGATDGHFVLTDVYLECNDAACRMWGYARQEIIGRSPADFSPPAQPDGRASAEAARAHLEQARAGTAQHFHWQHRRKDGTLIETEVLLHPITVGGRQLLHATVRDVTDRRRAEQALKLTQFSVDRAADMVYWIDAQGRIIYVNDAGVGALGYSRDLLLTMRVSDIDPDMPASAWERHWAELRQRGTMIFESRHRTQQGRVFPVEVSANHTALGGQEYNFAFVRDITQRKAAEEALRTTQERYALAERGTNDGLWDWDLASNRIYFSPRAKRLLGYAETDAIDSPLAWFARVDSADAMRVKADLGLHLAGRSSQFQNEHRVLHADGTRLWVFCRGVAVRDPRGHAVRIAGALSDITDRKTAEERLRLAAQTDMLTGLPNRSVLYERINQAIREHQTSPEHKFGVLFLDFDRFKIINDSLGHQTGDRLLIEIAERLRTNLRKMDIICHTGVAHALAARLGGDEFVVLLDGLARSTDASLVAERLRQALAKPYRIYGHEVNSTASIGITTSDAGHDRAEDVLRDADTAMYHAKAGGRDRQVVFDHHMHEEVATRLALDNDLRKALELNQLSLLYQPIVQLDSGRLLGFEALLRWTHPQRGLVPPALFVPLAEENGLIVPIGQWVMAQACRDLTAIRAACGRPDLSVSVNLSRRQLAQPDLPEAVDAAVRAAGLEHRALRVEITESTVMQDPVAALVVLQRIKDLNVRLDMDDFGTGHSSLSCLHRFPLDGLKIDRAFISNMVNRPDYAAVIQAIVTLAHNLGIKVTAEGLENIEQVVQLQTLECDHGQGYYFSKPLTSAQAPGFVQARERQIA